MHNSPAAAAPSASEVPSGTILASSFTWPAVWDWLAGLAILIVVSTAAVAITRSMLFFLLGMLAAQLSFLWRVARIKPAVTAVQAQATTGQLHLVVMDRGGSGFRAVWNHDNPTLHIAQGTVWLGNESWPAAQVAVTGQPNWFIGRGIPLNTPSGKRFISAVPGGDPALYWAFIIDRPVATAIEQVLRAQSSSVGRFGAPQFGVHQFGVPAPSAPPSAPMPAGWYPDPGQAGRHRWWDGTTWTEHTG